MENKSNQTIAEPLIESDNKNSLATENGSTANQGPDPEVYGGADKPTKLKGVTALFKESFAIYKLRFKKLLGIMLVPLSINILFAAILYLYLLFSNSQSIFILLTAIINIASSIATPLISALAVLALVFQLKEGFGIKDSYKAGFKIFFSYLWTALLSSLIFLGASMTIGLISLLFFIIPSKDSFAYTPVTLIVIIVGAVAVLAVFVPFIFIPFMRVIEGIKGMNCLLACEWLVRKRTISVLFRFIMVGLFIFPIVIIFSFILKAFALKLIVDPYLSNFITNKLGAGLLQLIFTPISIVYWGLLYEDLKKSKNIYLYSESSKKTKKIYITLICLGVLSPLIIFGIFASFYYSMLKTGPASPSRPDFSTPTQSEESTQTMSDQWLE